MTLILVSVPLTILAALAISWLSERLKACEKSNIPIVGPMVHLTTWPAAFLNIWQARKSIHTGYHKYKESLFQLPTMTRMEIFICDPAMVREYRGLDEESMSSLAIISELFQAKWCMPGADPDVCRIPTSVIAKALAWQRSRSRNIKDRYFDEFVEEFLHGMEEEMPKFTDGWVSVCCFRLGTRLMSRLTAKSLLGRPACRDSEVIDLFYRYGNTVPPDGFFLSCVPAPFKPLVAKLLASPKIAKQSIAIALSEIQSRRQTSVNRMDDILDFYMDWVDTNYPTAYDDFHIAEAITSSVFGAIHTTSQLMVQTIFELAARPEYALPLREEIRTCVEEYGGYTKEGLNAMHKLDSFIRESQRWNPLDAGSMARRVMKPFTFKNGVHLRQGDWIFTPNSPLLEEDRFYDHASRFDGFRFARMREDPRLKLSCALTSTSEYNLQFGDGKHTCPGRFMASDEIKLTIAFFVMNYDVAFENMGSRPANVAIGKFNFPDKGANIWVRPAKVQ